MVKNEKGIKKFVKGKIRKQHKGRTAIVQLNFIWMAKDGQNMFIIQFGKILEMAVNQTTS